MMNTGLPNIILIVADDLGYGDLGCFGNPDIRTPHIDRLATEGVSLMQHYSGSPLCAPARASLLTGRYNHRTGAVDVPSNRGLDRIALSEATIADMMKSAGYATGMVGKWKLYLPPIPEADVKDPTDNEPYYRGLTEPHTLLDIETSLQERSLSAPRAPRLFDLDADPCEHTDLAGEHPERVASMLKQWDDWFEEMLAEWGAARAKVIRTGTT